MTDPHLLLAFAACAAVPFVPILFAVSGVKLLSSRLVSARFRSCEIRYRYRYASASASFAVLT